jgi:periodic tryptophan protein 1
VLASGSADCKVKLWDLFSSKCQSTLEHHSDKVQSVRWHSTEEKILASGGLQGHFYVRAVDNPGSGISAAVPAAIEGLAWNPFRPDELALSTEDGYFYSFDVRKTGSPLVELKAHTGACSFSYSRALEGMMATAGKDKMVRVWDARGMEMMAERNAGVEQLFCVEMYKDEPFVLATGGMGGEIAVWDTEENARVSERWSR